MPFNNKIYKIVEIAIYFSEKSALSELILVNFFQLEWINIKSPFSDIYLIRIRFCVLAMLYNNIVRARCAIEMS